MIVGLGIDLVEIARVERLVASKGERALRRLFTDAEAAYALGRGEPYRHLAARVATKEATYKALAGTPEARAIGWLEIEVVLADDGRPTLCLHGRASARAAELGASRRWLALSHSATTAVAAVVLERGDA